MEWFRKSKRRQRTFQPTVFSLEERKLLSIYMRSGSVSYLTAWSPAPATQFLGYVSSDSSIDVKDPLSVTVDWGDGTDPTTTSNAGIVWNVNYANAVNSQGHSFHKSGYLPINITVTDQHGGSVSWIDYFSVSDAPVNCTQEEATPVGVACNVVGAKFRIDTQLVSQDPTAVIDNVVYSFTEPNGSAGGALSIPKDGTPLVDATGYHEDEVRSDYGTIDGPTHASIEDYWDSVPGVHSVTATIHWHNSNGLPFSYTLDPCTYNITRPTVTMTTDMNSGDDAIVPIANFDMNIGNYYTMITAGPNNAKEAMSLSVSIDPSQPGVTDGTYGVVQTMERNLFRWTNNLKTRTYSTGGDATDSLLDPTPQWETSDGNFTPYYGTAALDKNGVPVIDQDHSNAIVTPSVTSWNVGTTGSIADSPNASIFPSFGVVALSDSAIYTDTVMFTPSGGIPVPVASLQWGYRGTMALGADGKPTVFWTSSPDIVTPAEPTTEFPTWIGLASNYRTKMPVEWTPIPVDPNV